MNINISILDYLTNMLRLDYMSDLHYLNRNQRIMAATILSQKLSSDSASLDEWNDALFYLANKGPAATAESAKAQLITILEK